MGMGSVCQASEMATLCTSPTTATIFVHMTQDEEEVSARGRGGVGTWVYRGGVCRKEEDNVNTVPAQPPFPISKS